MLPMGLTSYYRNNFIIINNKIGDLHKRLGEKERKKKDRKKDRKEE